MHDDDTISNPTDNPYFGDIAGDQLSRRAVLGGALAAAAAGMVGLASRPVGAQEAPAAGATARRASGPGFTPIAPSTDDAIRVPPGYVAEVLLPWGTPLLAGAPDWKGDATETAAEQALQVGSHHDGMHYFPLGKGKRGSQSGLLVLNHEYNDRTLTYADGDAVITQEKVDKALAAHGNTVAQIALTSGGWELVSGSPYNRRITGTTPMTFSGPLGPDHPALQANGEPMGTLNNCANGYTPWGTYLTCEENWNGYFGTTDAGWTPTPEQARYGVSAGGFGYRWHLADPRFDVAVNPNELHRFGWVVEIDPTDPSSTPVKRTALGRFKHEGATVTEVNGHAVVYLGDDENRDYVYKWVSARPWKKMRNEGVSPLDEGTLYVARFDAGGSGTWLPLVHGTGPLVAPAFADQADISLRTREAADAVGATRMDRPEWVAVHPKTGEVYLACTNGSAGALPASAAANPRSPNPYGHIIRWKERKGNVGSFTWSVFLLAGDPTKDATVTVADEDRFGSPDGLWFDPDGRLWIQTDISNSVQRSGGYDRIGNNQMLCANPATGELKRFLTGPNGCEITGATATPDGTTMFINVQHPGEATTAIGTPTPATPTAVSSWPDGGRPRSATVVIRKIGGGIIGT